MAGESKRFYCKYEGCPYSSGSRLYFLKNQYLKQHYDKVHAEKIYGCPLCTKSFSTTTLLKSHVKYCGKEFTCSCGVVYKSNEALLTHAKRKRHSLGPVPRTEPISTKTGTPTPKKASVLVSIPVGAQVLIIHPNINQASQTSNSSTLNEPVNQLSRLHAMAAVALSGLATTTPFSRQKKDIAIQTDPNSQDIWTNIVANDFPIPAQKINSSGTQTDIGCEEDSPRDPGSPWLGLSAETQTVDDEIVLKPFNLCSIQTQTPWNEISEDDAIELTHSETQTLLSSFLMDEGTLTDYHSSRSKGIFAKQNSEDAGTDPMEMFN